MVRVVQCQHGDPWQRLAWDPRIAGLSISLTDKGEGTLARHLRVIHGGLAVPHYGSNMCS
jgi:hypothetical protein